MKKLSIGHIKAICYADVFDYPLTMSELDTYQIQNNKSKNIDKLVESKDGYYFLKGREKIVTIRKQREEYSKRKTKIAQRVGKELYYIPTIQMVAVTGALARNNAKKDDDIDLLIVTESGWMWTTRLLTVLITELLGARRRPGSSDVSDKICLNMFIDNDHLSVPKGEQDLFSAYEVAGMNVLWDRNNTENSFYKENSWVKTYLPNSTIFRSGQSRKKQNKLQFSFIENMAKSIQLKYMESRRTNEVIRDGYMRFHPMDARRWVMRGYKKRLREIGLE